MSHIVQIRAEGRQALAGKGFGNSAVASFDSSTPLKLDCDRDLAPFEIAYQTYGTLNAAKSNAILICHALTGDQHVANTHPITGKPGWWSTLVGPGRPVDTDRFFVICSNILGGCLGSTGPASIDPATGKPYGLHFPVITIGDMVDAQVRLIDRLGNSAEHGFHLLTHGCHKRSAIHLRHRFHDKVSVG